MSVLLVNLKWLNEFLVVLLLIWMVLVFVMVYVILLVDDVFVWVRCVVFRVVEVNVGLIIRLDGLLMVRFLIERLCVLICLVVKVLVIILFVVMVFVVMFGLMIFSMMIELMLEMFEIIDVLFIVLKWM